MRHVPAWLGLSVATAALGTAMAAVGLPSSYLFAALVLGLGVALARPDAMEVPAGAFTAAQAVTGVTLGAYLESRSLRVIGDAWLAVALVTTGTLVLSIGAGMLLARVTGLDAPTAALGMIAGGASGIVSMARELEGDDRLVAFMQYARILVVVLLTPLLVAIAFPASEVVDMVNAGEPVVGDAGAWLLVAAIAAAGALVGARLRMPAGPLLGPMILAGVLTLTGAVGDLSVPPLLRETAFAVIGLQVGLRFTLATVRQVGRLLAPVMATILALLVACFGLAVALAAATPVSLLDAYLATTPGGLYAVVAVAFGAGADTTFIVAVQGLRVLAMVLLAPLVVRLLIGRPARAVR